MGMTMNKAINGIEKRILPIYDNDADHETLVMAIDTMRKYQKIEKIIKNAGIFAFDVPEIRRIAEVMKDGNNKNSTNLDSN